MQGKVTFKICLSYRKYLSLSSCLNLRYSGQKKRERASKSLRKKQRSSVRRKRNTEKYDFDHTLQGYFIQNSVGFNCQASKMKIKTPKWSIQRIYCITNHLKPSNNFFCEKQTSQSLVSKMYCSKICHSKCKNQLCLASLMSNLHIWVNCCYYQSLPSISNHFNMVDPFSCFFRR